MRYEHITSKKEQTEHKEFCKTNKIPIRYYRQRNAIPFDPNTIDEFVKDYPSKLTARDLEQVRDKLTIDSKVLEELYYKELIRKIAQKLNPLSKKVFRFMTKEFNQNEIAKKLNVSVRTVRRHVKKVREIVRKVLKRCPTA